ncbi:MAG TPA: HlyD family efflux transporter periplasmic adaptor subunit [Polyangiaceae bacterium]|jgi:HlyD family secretion protein|nr:HlyD family efflux transporter periplasmic adaptor subunit [Polyangiaceae bacterium]
MSTLETSAPLDDAASPSTRPPVDVARKKARDRRRALARNARHAMLALLLAAAGVGTVLAMRPQPVPIDAARVLRGPLVVAIVEDGTTRVKDRYLVSAPVTGSLSRLGLEPGDAVKEGDPLAEIAPTQSPLLDERTRAEAQARLGAARSALGQAQAQVSRARVAKELAEQELARDKKLSLNGSIPAQALEQAEFAVRMRDEELSSAEFGSKVAVEEVRVARVALGREGSGAPKDHHVDVLSPVSGRVLGIHHKSAGVVQASTPLVEVGDPSALEVVVDLLTTDAVHVLPGTPVVIRGWGGDHPIEGRVRRVEPSAFTRPSALGVDEQRVNVIVALTDPRRQWETLGDGYRVEARIVLWQAERVLKVPQGAVFRHGDGWAVFVVNGNVARLTPVTLGHRGETEAEISAGLAEGTAVAVHPGDRVKDGARVEPR